MVHQLLMAEAGDALEASLAAVKSAYADRRPSSAEQAKIARRFLPAGSTRSTLDFDPFPFRIANADGAELVDVDGHRYVDFLGDYTAGLLGHSPPEIKEAISEALDRGLSLGAPADGEHRLAELLCDRFPSLQLMRFTNSGTEANLMAIAAARHHTKRSKVLVFDGAYHGGLLYFGQAGEGTLAPFDYVRCPYNDLDAVTKALADHLDVACILVEPMMGSGGCIPGRHDFLAGLRDLCRSTGVVLIFDEVMTSRMSIGGAQRRLAVRPDLTTLGKYLGGGLTFGAFGGRDEIMRAFDPSRGGELSHGGTFNNNVVTIAAGVAAVEQVLTREALDSLFDRGEQFRAAVGEALAPIGMSATGWGSLLSIHAMTGPVRRPADLAEVDPRIGELVFHKLLDHGIFMARRGFVALSLAIDDDHQQRFLDALKHVTEDLLTSKAVRPIG